MRFKATLTAKVIPWRSVTRMHFLAFSHQDYHNFSFQSHRLLFSHASAEVRGENTPERKVASTRDQTHKHQVMSPTRSPLSHPSGAKLFITFNPFPNNPWFLRVCLTSLENRVTKGEIAPTLFSTLWGNFLPFSSILKFLSANSFSLEECKIYRLGKG